MGYPQYFVFNNTNILSLKIKLEVPHKPNVFVCSAFLAILKIKCIELNNDRILIIESYIIDFFD